jgi:tetratricopeptide (TPR) repeat protein
MTGTLIVRDATLAINGAPETRGEPKEFLQDRVQETAKLDAKTIEDCAEVLIASASGEDPDPEVLEALTILGLAQPHIASQLGVNALAHGRRLAARLERDGVVEHAVAVLQFLVDTNPGHRALERDLAAMMRRTGMANDLIDRYIARAQALLKEGRTQEAIAWYREVLLLDRSRKDVARTIRDLRFQEVDDQGLRKRRRRIIAVVLLVSTILTAVGLHEKMVRDEFHNLAGYQPGDVGSMQDRLDTLEAFVDEHPVWHGALGVLSERSRLRVELQRLRDEIASRKEKESATLARMQDAAELARRRARIHAENNDFPSALRELANALELAPPDWSEREQVERDVAAIREYLAEGEK